MNVTNMRRTPGHKLGRRAEWAALVLLMAKGYRPRHRNWRGAGGELDLVMRHHDETVFVEVKARSGDLYGGAVAALNAKKQKSQLLYSCWKKGSIQTLFTGENKNGKSIVPVRTL